MLIFIRLFAKMYISMLNITREKEREEGEREWKLKFL